LEDCEGDETPQPAVNSDPFKRRYQVFVSSTYVDLVQERQAVMHALLELDCIPSGMELFPAADDDQWTLIKRVIDDCDYYIVIIAGRYGSQAPHGISYTQMEYEYALSRNKPVIAFLHKNPTAISVQNFEQTDDGRKKLEDFRALAERKVCKYWATPDELGSVVSRSLIQLIKTKPAVGWVKGNLVAAESSAQELLKLRRRIEELQGMVPNEPDIRPIARRVEYYSTLAEAFPRNAIQETWSYVESTLRYVLLTHDLDNSGNFTQQIVDLFAHGDLDAERKESIVEFYELACRAKCDPAFKITTEEALKNIDEMIHFSKRLVESCDTLWNLRKAGTV
jgi:ribosomal protein L30E